MLRRILEEESIIYCFDLLKYKDNNGLHLFYVAGSIPDDVTGIFH
jgi:hypothetical protein